MLKDKVVYENLNPNFGYYYPIDEILVETKTDYQNLQLVKTKELGNVLLLDGITQVAEKHDYLYHESLVHPAMLLHGKPEEILLIGAGDGGCSREILKYPTVKNSMKVS
jgi:spermidine synthase